MLIYMQFKKLLNSSLGKIIISILLGIGLASLFRQACNSKYCIDFKGPIISEIDGKIQKFDSDCYKYELVSAKCNTNKQIIPIETKE